MYKVPEEWKLSDFLELSNDEKLKWLYNGVKNGGGGGGSSDAFEVNFTLEWDQESRTYIPTSDKTYSEISAAYTDNKKIYAWLYYGDIVYLTNAYYELGGAGFNFNFDDKTEFGLDGKYIITVTSESISADIYSGAAPVYIIGDYASGDALTDTDFQRFEVAMGNDSFAYINIDLIDSDAGESYSGTCIFTNLYDGYCFAGHPNIIGATAVIDGETGEITVTAPNS